MFIDTAASHANDAFISYRRADFSIARPLHKLLGLKRPAHTARPRLHRPVTPRAAPQPTAALSLERYGAWRERRHEQSE